MAQITCPRCGNLANRGGYPVWAIVVAICFFPIGLLALLVQREPTKCPSCGNIWQA
jgi:hypothetical protein